MPSNYSISPLEASQYLKIPIAELMNYVKEGKIESKIVQNNRVFNRNELRRFNNDTLKLEENTDV